MQELHGYGNTVCTISLFNALVCLHVSSITWTRPTQSAGTCHNSIKLLLQILNGDFLPTDNLYFKGMTLARCFRVLDSVVLAILIYLGALAFKRVVASEKNQLAYCIQVGHPVTSFIKQAFLT